MRSIPSSVNEEGATHFTLVEKEVALFNKTTELRAKGLSNPEIARELGVNIDRVRAWARGEKPKRVHRYEPDLTPSKDLAYVAGFYLGDGKDAGEEHKVRFELADREQLEYVGGLVAKILERDPKPLGLDGAFYTVQYDSVILSDFLNQDVEALVEYLQTFVQDFLRGFFDAEGHVSAVIDFNSSALESILVGAANTNNEYLSSAAGILANLGIKAKIRRTNRRGEVMTIRGRSWIRKRDVYHCVIVGWVQVRNFCGLVGFHNEAKAEKLEDLVRIGNKSPQARFAWFMANYEKRGRKWVKRAR